MVWKDCMGWVQRKAAESQMGLCVTHMNLSYKCTFFSTFRVGFKWRCGNGISSGAISILLVMTTCALSLCLWDPFYIPVALQDHDCANKTHNMDTVVNGARTFFVCAGKLDESTQHSCISRRLAFNKTSLMWNICFGLPCHHQMFPETVSNTNTCFCRVWKWYPLLMFIATVCSATFQACCEKSKGTFKALIFFQKLQRFQNIQHCQHFQHFKLFNTFKT